MIKADQSLTRKTQEHKTLEDPQYLLFEKCMRGDTSDNVFSAYPGVRKKGTKNKTGLLEAYADKEKGGFNWNNIMLQRWTITMKRNIEYVMIMNAIAH